MIFEVLVGVIFGRRRRRRYEVFQKGSGESGGTASNTKDKKIDYVVVDVNIVVGGVFVVVGGVSPSPPSPVAPPPSFPPPPDDDI